MSNTSRSPIFVACPPRSGSTLLSYILDASPDVWCPGELYLTVLYTRMKEFLQVYYEDYPGIVAETDADRQIARWIRTRMARLARAHGKKRWADKSPATNALHHDVLLRMFPKAIFITLYRGCLDTMRSCAEFGRRHTLPMLLHYNSRFENPVHALAQYWCDIVEAQLVLERRPGARVFRVRYEDLVRQPERVTSEMFAFLEVEWSPTLLKSMFVSPRKHRWGDTKILSTDRIHCRSLGRGHRLRSAMNKQLAQRVDGLMNELGYSEK